ncbi:mRNA capping enzyme, putative [Ricinus communis]|uniref:mRNA guanylyltransferase n=1 Tax=Ricinus communis TaxID=3988 RepID=B9S446_RICCO|nr:mRNA capping enzyme, putative [Ricinus communis]
MDLNSSVQPHKYEEKKKGILGRFSGREHVDKADSERRQQWGMKRKFPGEGQMHGHQSFTRDNRGFDFGNRGFYDEHMLPPGWLGCPPYGEAIGCLIPSKVPLGESFNQHIPGKRYTPKHVLNEQRLLGRELGLVIDLTNTNRYYPISAWSEEGISHIKIRCKGRDSVPDDESVEKFVHEVSKFCSQGTHAEKYILVHCTHGHNRTGYMIAHFLKRTRSISITEAIDIFAKARPPGIYKEEYIDSLYTFYDEKRPDQVVCPQTPEWKRCDDANTDGEAMQEHKNSAAPLHENHVMTNDDLLGDAVSFDKLRELRQMCYQLLKLGMPARGNLQFPGSHPVSLNGGQLTTLKTAVLLCHMEGRWNTISDANHLGWIVDMRFPCKQTDKGMTDQIHNYTLLDGEMVIDTDSNTQKQERRYLIYDVMAINETSLVEMPFHVRWRMLNKEVIEPRNQEREVLSKSTNPYYRYDLEPFSVRRKDFWLLSTVDKLLKKFIPKLPHEADGLIFQGWDDPYVPRTHEGLLKWKYVHMNSVDFLFELGGHGHQLFLYERGRKKLLHGNRVVFNDASDPSSYSGKIIECSWDSERQLWIYMRIRTDKSTPNEFNTYRKVMRSIRDNITEEVLFKEIDEIINLPMYADRIKNDIRAHQNTVSARRK